MELLLDDLGYLQRLDPRQMLERIQEFPVQCQVAWELASRFPWPKAPESLANVVIAGMGGSAIAGELLASLTVDTCPVPILVHRDYGLPAYVGSKSLVIASSYSGNTEETLSAVQQALTRGALVVALTSGGELYRLAEKTGLAVFPIKYQASPRAALAHSFVPLLYFLQRLGLLPDQQAPLTNAVAAMQAMERMVGAKIPTRSNLAKQLAHHCHGRLTVVYGADFLGSVARRWKTQLNENSKAWAFCETLPELNHNAVLGYEQPDNLANDTFVALLQSSLNRPENQRRTVATAQVLAQAGVRHQIIEVEGTTRLAQMLSAIHLGDYVSFYLAILYGLDPTPIPAIDRLKEQLQSRVL